jgi:hypothetical protein
MFDLNDGNDTVNAGNYGFNDADIPEPIEHWSLDDFEDFLPDTLR